MARRIIGLDLGAYSIKLLRLEAGKQHLKFEVIDAIEEIIPVGDADNPDGMSLLERQREIIAKFAQAGLLENEGAAIALPAADGQMRVITVPFSDTRKIEAILPGLIEAEVPFDLSDMALTWHRQEHALATTQESTETNIRLAFGKKQSIAAMLHMLQPLAFDPRQMLLGSAALYELVRHVGFHAFLGNQPTGNMSAIIDLGHRATNLCVFDQYGLVFTRSFLHGGKKLSEEIAHALNISFAEAEELKHEKLDLLQAAPNYEAQKIQELARAHYLELAHTISRLFISSKTNGHGSVATIALVGGGAKASGLDRLYAEKFGDLGCSFISLNSLVPSYVKLPSMAMAYSLALSGVHVHAKESRFNFRKDEFAWRGEYDFIRAKSGPLLLWLLVIISSLTIMYSAKSLVLDKENKTLEAQIHATCIEILGKSDVSTKKCLSLMKEQISARAEVEIPEFTAADVYLKAAQGLSKDINIIVGELDISEKKVRLTAETTYADMDKIVSSWSKIPCFVKVENTGAQPAGNKVKFTLTNDIDCQAPVQEKNPKTAENSEPAHKLSTTTAEDNSAASPFPPVEPMIAPPNASVQ